MTLQQVASKLEERTGLTAFVHAVDIDHGRETGIRAEESVVSASVFKVPVLVEACRQIAAGEIDPTQQIHLGTEDYRVLGYTGIAAFCDPVTLSFRDLCLSMMQVSDNRATDAVMNILGLESITVTLAELSFTHTVLEGDCAHLFATMWEDLAELGYGEIQTFREAGESLLQLRALDPKQANRSTPKETSALFSMLWRQESLDPTACAEARRILEQQAWSHRLSSGFPDDEISTCGKTGTLPYIRNEAGVVEYPDGGRYAVSVFLRLPTSASAVPHFDAAIGILAAAAVDELRS